MKKLYFLDEEEKNRILNIHESATKRHYLSEQGLPAVPQSVTDPYGVNLPGEQQNFQKSQQQIVQQQKLQQQKLQQQKLQQQKLQQQKLQQRREQVKSQTDSITKQIQTLLGLEGTGIMDTSLLQTINTKLNGTQPVTQTTTLPQKSPFSPDKPENQIPDLKLKSFNPNTSSQLNLTDDQINQTMDKLLNKPQ